MTTPFSAPHDRRGFLAKLLALGLGTVALAVPTLSALAAFLNPWRQKSATGNWVRVASKAAVPVGGPPQRCPVIADRSDAWNGYPAEAVGAIFLCQVSDDKFLALANDLPAQRRLRFLRSGKEEFLLPFARRVVRSRKAAGSIRRASARGTSIRWRSKSATARRSG